MSGLNSVLTPRPTGKWAGCTVMTLPFPRPFSVPLPVPLSDDDSGVSFAGADFRLRHRYEAAIRLPADVCDIDGLTQTTASNSASR